MAATAKKQRPNPAALDAICKASVIRVTEKTGRSVCNRSIASSPSQVNSSRHFKEILLKRFIGYAAILTLLSIPAFAAKNSETITISQPVTVGTTQIPAADYKVTWNEAGSNGQVTLAHGKSVFTLPAKVVAQKHSVPSVLTDSRDGGKILVGLDLSKVSVEFTPAPSSGQ